MISINVAQLLKLPPGTVRDVEFEDPFQEALADVNVIDSVRGQAKLTRTSRGVLAVVKYSTAVGLACGRCLEPVEASVNGEIADEFLPTVDVVSGFPLDEVAESPELAIDNHHMLNLSEVIRQDLLTRVPLQVLCSQSCPGICLRCGADRRDTPCACAAESSETSPFAQLAGLLTSQPQKETEQRS